MAPLRARLPQPLGPGGDHGPDSAGRAPVPRGARPDCRRPDHRPVRWEGGAGGGRRRTAGGTTGWRAERPILDRSAAASRRAESTTVVGRPQGPDRWAGGSRDRGRRRHGPGSAAAVAGRRPAVIRRTGLRLRSSAPSAGDGSSGRRPGSAPIIVGPGRARRRRPGCLDGRPRLEGCCGRLSPPVKGRVLRVRSSGRPWPRARPSPEGPGRGGRRSSPPAAGRTPAARAPAVGNRDGGCRRPRRTICRSVGPTIRVDDRLPTPTTSPTVGRTTAAGGPWRPLGARLGTLPGLVVGGRTTGDHGLQTTGRPVRPEREKGSPRGAFFKEIPAATYSPRGTPPKYHRRGWA